MTEALVELKLLAEKLAVHVSMVDRGLVPFFQTDQERLRKVIESLTKVEDDG